MFSIIFDRLQTRYRNVRERRATFFIVRLGSTAIFQQRVTLSPDRDQSLQPLLGPPALGTDDRDGRAQRHPDQGGQGGQRGVLRAQRRLHPGRQDSRSGTEPRGAAAGPSDRCHRQAGHPRRDRHAHAHGAGVHGNQGGG